MSRYRYVTVKCDRCTVEVSGKLDGETGEVFAARQPRNDAEMIIGWCVDCKNKPAHGSAHRDMA